jgi:hypothetical protein
VGTVKTVALLKSPGRHSGLFYVCAEGMEIRDLGIRMIFLVVAFHSTNRTRRPEGTLSMVIGCYPQIVPNGTSVHCGLMRIKHARAKGLISLKRYNLASRLKPRRACFVASINAIVTLIKLYKSAPHNKTNKSTINPSAHRAVC